MPSFTVAAVNPPPRAGSLPRPAARAAGFARTQRLASRRALRS